MADEITVTVRTQLSNGTLTDDFRPGNITVDQTTSGMSCQVLSIGTSEEDITFGDVATEGVCTLYNLDATNYVLWGKKDGSGNMQAIGKLKPSHIPAVFNFNAGSTLRMQANTAACKVRICLYEE
jgi:hypothetical protein